ncbi:peptidoglycan-binding domain-containing protein [Nostoc sp.]
MSDQDTEEAIKLFQEKNGLDKTGIVDSKTSEKLGLYTNHLSSL